MSRPLVSSLFLALSLMVSAAHAETAIVRLAGEPVPAQPGEGRKSGRINLQKAMRRSFAANSGRVMGMIGEWQTAAAQARAKGQPVVRDVSEVTELWTINALIVKGTDEAIRSLSAHPDVTAVIPDQPRQLPEVRVTAGTLKGPYTYGLVKIGADRVQTQLNQAGEGVTIGILDTGIDAQHPDLKGKVLKFKSFVQAADPNAPIDDHGHGTHCAGTIAGGNAGGTQIGIAPKAKLIIGKIFSGSGSTTDAAILGAMNWIADPDGNPDTDDAPALVSNSWGGSQGSEGSEKPYWDLVATWERLGIFPSFAAGNEGPGSGTMSTPGGFPHSFAAGATDSADKIAYFSSRGPIQWAGVSYTKPDVSAPGVDVISAKPGGGYQSMDGTSMACPHVSGTAGLLYALNPDYTVAQVKQLLKDTAQDLGAPGHDNNFGVGRINAFAASQIALNGGKINVRLTNEAGQAIAGRVRITNGASTSITDSGTSTLILVAGSYTLVASSFGYLESAPLTVEVVSGQVTEAAFSLKQAPTGNLKVTVKDASTGAALPAKVAILDTPVTEAQADPATGLASVALPYGTYSIKVRAFAHDAKQIDNVKIDGGEVALDVALDHLPDILLYDNDGGKAYEAFYKAALTALNKPFTYLDGSKEVDAETLSAYPIIIYFTGDDYSETISTAMQEKLRAFVASGGHLLVSGQDVAYDLKNSPFLADILHAKFVKDTAGSRDVAGSGLTFSISGGDGASNQKYPDVIENAGGEVLFNYGGDEGPAGIFAGGVAYLPWGIEGISTAANRQAVVDLLVKKLAPTASQRAARLAPLTRMFGADAGALYRAYLVDWYEHLTPAEQQAAQGILRGLTPRD